MTPRRAVMVVVEIDEQDALQLVATARTYGTHRLTGEVGHQLADRVLASATRVLLADVAPTVTDVEALT